MNKCIVFKEKWKETGEDINKWLSDNPGVKIITMSQIFLKVGMGPGIWTTIIYDE